LTWSPLTPPPAGGEVQKTRWRAVPFTSGRGLDLGCGIEKLFDTEYVIGIDNGHDAEHHGAKVNANIRMDCRELTQFSAQSFDYIFSSFLLQYFPYKDVPDVLRAWMRLIKTNGFLVLYLPDEAQYPKCPEPEREIVGEQGQHPSQKWNVNYDRLCAAMDKVACAWDLVDYQVCGGDDEYGLFFAWRKLK
jgi:Methyltransferase domain